MISFFYADGHSGLYCGKFAPWVSFTLRLSCICVIVVSYLLGFCGRCCCTISCALLQADNLTDPCSICFACTFRWFSIPNDKRQRPFRVPLGGGKDGETDKLHRWNVRFFFRHTCSSAIATKLTSVEILIHVTDNSPGVWGSRPQAPPPPIRHVGISTTSLKPKLFHRQDRILTLMLKYSKYTDHEIFLKLLMLLGKNNSVFSEFKSVPPLPPIKIFRFARLTFCYVNAMYACEFSGFEFQAITLFSRIVLIFSYQIMLGCWSHECGDRPSFQSLKEQLFDMQKEEKPYVNVDPSHDFSLPPTAGLGKSHSVTGIPRGPIRSLNAGSCKRSQTQNLVFEKISVHFLAFLLEKQAA